MTRKILLSLATAVTLATPLAAQTRKTFKVPPGHMPPAGMCRVWVDGVPPGRQSAPTDCRTAELNRPANSHVVYGASSSGSVWRNGLNVTRDRDSLGRVIFRDASGRVVTRERTSDGWFIWRDANGNVLRREQVGDRRDDRDSDDKLSKSEKERLKAARKADKHRMKEDGKLQKGHDRDDEDTDDDRDGKNKGKGKGKSKG